jgi:hypothetical protein
VATRSSPLNLWDVIRKIERRLATLETGSGMDWTVPTLLNSWVNYGAGYVGARYRRTSSGQVEIQGLVKNGTVSTGSTGNIFLLPVGYRPDATLTFRTIATDAIARLDIYADGSVRAMSGTTSWYSINCVFTPIAG